METTFSTLLSLECLWNEFSELSRLQQPMSWFSKDLPVRSRIEINTICLPSFKFIIELPEVILKCRGRLKLYIQCTLMVYMYDCKDLRYFLGDFGRCSLSWTYTGDKWQYSHCLHTGTGSEVSTVILLILYFNFWTKIRILKINMWKKLSA